MAWTAVVAVARVELRRRWRSLVAIGVVAGMVGAVVLGAVSVARRTGTATARLERATHLDDARVMVFGPGDLAGRVAALPQVAGSWTASYGVGRLEGGNVVYLGVVTGPPRPPGLFTPVVVDGRPFRDDAEDEVLVEERAARELGLRPGATFSLHMLLPEEMAQFDTGFGEPDGPRLALRVAGIARLPGGDNRMPIVASPALAARYGRAIEAGPMVFARLRNGQRSVPAFSAAVESLARGAVPGAGAQEFSPLQVTNPFEAERSVAAAGRVLLGGLAVCVAVAAVAGLLAIGQAFGRQHAAGAADQRVEAALGMTAGERAAARTLPALVAVVLAFVIAFIGGLVAGAIEPLGALRRIEPHPGWAPNLALSVVGALLAGGCVLAVAAVTARRAGRPDRTAATTPRAGRARLLPAGGAAAAVGVRFALDRGRERLPVRSSLAAVVFGVAGVVAALTFASSLGRLDSTPHRWGWNGAFVVEDVNDEVVAGLLADRRVWGLSVVRSSNVRLAGADLSVYTFDSRRRSPGWTILAGRLPSGPGEIVLGSHLAARTDIGPGGVVRADPAEGPPVQLRVVGVGIGPSLNDERLGEDGLVTPATLGTVARTAPFTQALVAPAAGVDASRLAADLSGRFEVTPRRQPADVANVAQLGGLPEALGGFLALVAVVALAHALVVTVRRRRADIGVLRAIGFTPRQAGTVIVAMAGTTALAGLVVGVPAGFLVGRVVWWGVAHAVAVAGDVAVPVLDIVVVAVALVVVALVVALLPARRAVRIRPASVLRVE